MQDYRLNKVSKEPLASTISLVLITESLSIYRLFSEWFTEWVWFKKQSHVRVWSCFVNLFAIKTHTKKIRFIIKLALCLPFFCGKTIAHWWNYIWMLKRFPTCLYFKFLMQFCHFFCHICIEACLSLVEFVKFTSNNSGFSDLRELRDINLQLREVNPEMREGKSEFWVCINWLLLRDVTWYRAIQIFFSVLREKMSELWDKKSQLPSLFCGSNNKKLKSNKYVNSEFWRNKVRIS